MRTNDELDLFKNMRDGRLEHNKVTRRDLAGESIGREHEVSLLLASLSVRGCGVSLIDLIDAIMDNIVCILDLVLIVGSAGFLTALMVSQAKTYPSCHVQTPLNIH